MRNPNYRHPHLKAWGDFSAAAYDWIEQSRQGHYAVDEPEIEPMDFFAAFFGYDYLASQVCKYVCRLKHTRKHSDLLKAAHYLCRMYQKLLAEAPKL